MIPEGLEPTRDLVQAERPSKWREIIIYDDASEAAKKSAVRLNALASLYYFSRNVLGHLRLSPQLHGYMCRELERDSLRLVMEIPRDHFKTSLASVSAPMWWALPFTAEDEDLMYALGYSDSWIRWMQRAHYSSTRTLIASETISNARKIGVKIDGHYKSNSIFRYLFPGIIPKDSARWNQDSMTHNRLDGQYHGEGTFDFIGVRGALQSRHYDRQVIDDAVGEKAINSDLVMETTIDWVRKLPGAFDSDPKDPGKLADQLFIGNRWSHRDLNSWLRINVPNLKFITHACDGGCCDLHPAGIPIFPEEYTMEKLAEIRQIEGAYNFCTPGETPILMSDWTEKPIKHVVPGDVVMGYVWTGTKKKSNTQSNRWRLCPSVVKQSNFVGIRNVMEGVTDEGMIFRCTPDHKWWRRREPEGSHSVYAPVSIGSPIYKVYSPPLEPAQPEQRMLDWLGGILDGEGSCVGNVMISQSPDKNPEVCLEIERVLSELGIPYTVFDKEADSSQGRNNSRGRIYILNGGRSLKVRLLKHAHMVKRARFAKSISSGNVSREGVQKVSNLKLIGERPVYGLETETGNYIAWGFASQNSAQYRNNPIAPEAVRFKEAWLRHYSVDVWKQPDLSSQIVNWSQLSKSAREAINNGHSGDVVESYGATPQRLKVAINHEVQAGEVIEDIRAGDLDRVCLMDPNHAEEKGRARNATIVFGIYNRPPAKRRIYLLDCWAKSSSHEEWLDSALSTRPGNRGLAVKWRCHYLYIESEVAGQHGWKFAIRERMKSMGTDACFTLRPLKTERSSNAKHNRIISVESIYENGLFWVPRTGCGEWKQEYSEYPNGSTMDLLDLTGYISQVLGPGSRVAARDFVRDEMKRSRSMLDSIGKAGY